MSASVLLHGRHCFLCILPIFMHLAGVSHSHHRGRVWGARERDKECMKKSLCSVLNWTIFVLKVNLETGEMVPLPRVSVMWTWDCMVAHASLHSLGLQTPGLSVQLRFCERPCLKQTKKKAESKRILHWPLHMHTWGVPTTTHMHTPYTDTYPTHPICYTHTLNTQTHHTPLHTPQSQHPPSLRPPHTHTHTTNTHLIFFKVTLPTNPHM